MGTPSRSVRVEDADPDRGRPSEGGTQARGESGAAASATDEPSSNHPPAVPDDPPSEAFRRLTTASHNVQERPADAPYQQLQDDATYGLRLFDSPQDLRPPAPQGNRIYPQASGLPDAVD